MPVVRVVKMSVAQFYATTFLSLQIGEMLVCTLILHLCQPLACVWSFHSWGFFSIFFFFLT